MNSANFFSALPNFVSGVHALQTQLVTAAYVIAAAGLIIHAVLAMLGRNLATMFGSLVRLALIPIIIMGLESWGDLMVTAVNGLASEVGASGNGGNVFASYQAAIARKLGTQAAAANFAQQTQTGTPGQAVPSPLPAPGQATGVKLTAYGYAGDTSGDSASRQGIGAFAWDSAPGSLIPGYSAALTASAAAAYHVQPGQSFRVTTSGGQSYNLVYADVAPESDQRVDIYDPYQALSANDNNFEQTVTSVNGGAIVQGQTGNASLMPNPGGSIGDQVLWAITLGLSWIASGVMWLMTIAQQLLYLIEIAISPIFVACLMVPALTFLARKYFLTLVGICLWPLAWSICNLVTIALIDYAVNPTANGTLTGLNTAGAVTGPLAGVAYLLIIAVWVIGSTIAAPVFIGILLGSSGGATAAVFGATLGAAGASAMDKAAPSAGNAALSVVTNLGTGSNGSISRQSASAMNGVAPNYAKRP